MGLGWLLPILVPTRPVQLVLWRAGDRPGQTRSRTPCLPRTFPRKLVPTAGFEPATHGLGKHPGTGNDGTGRDGTGRDGTVAIRTSSQVNHYAVEAEGTGRNRVVPEL